MRLQKMALDGARMQGEALMKMMDSTAKITNPQEGTIIDEFV